MSDKGRVVVVDDFQEVLARLARVLAGAGHEVATYASPAEFLRAPRPAPPCCLLLDLDMPELTGLEVQRALLFGGHLIPMVFMSGHRDLPAAIQAMKGGALDFLLKPFPDATLLDAVGRALAQSAAQTAAREVVVEARRRLDSLTPREHEVCLLVAEGLTSKEIGERLGVAESTISVHRSRITTKLDATSIADIVRLVDLARG